MNVPDVVEQLAFPDLVLPDIERDATIQERFAAFHAANPHVYDRLRRLALELVRAGHKRIGIGMLFEVVRWSAMTTRGDDVYKLNNNHRSRYARLLVDNEPELATAFELRDLRAK